MANITDNLADCDVKHATRHFAADINPTAGSHHAAFYQNVLGRGAKSAPPSVFAALDGDGVVPSLKTRKVADNHVAAAVWVEAIGVWRAPRRFKHQIQQIDTAASVRMYGPKSRVLQSNARQSEVGTIRGLDERWSSICQICAVDSICRGGPPRCALLKKTYIRIFFK